MTEYHDVGDKPEDPYGNNPAQEDSFPEGFRLGKLGVFEVRKVKDDKEELVKISGRAWVTGLTRDHACNDWGRIVKWVTQDGQEREQAIPQARFHDQTMDLVQDLASKGLLIVPNREKKLRTYLGLFAPKSHIRCATKIGWMDMPDSSLVYVTPDEVLGKGGEGIVFQPETNVDPCDLIARSGTLDEWKERVAAPCDSYDVMVFSICKGLSGPLLKFAPRVGSGGVHLWGLTSRGKTTAQQVSASVFANGADPDHAPSLSYLRKWNHTRNNLEALAATRNHGTLYLDEIAQIPARDFGHVVYDLSGGQGKGAMNSKREMKKRRTWEINIFSTGEISTSDKVAEGGGTYKGGMGVRLVDINTNTMPIVPHGEDGKRLVDRLKVECGLYYGTAGLEFLKKLVEFETSMALKEKLDLVMDACYSDLVKEGMTPEQTRTMKRFALYMAAGLLAAEWGIVPFTPERIHESILYVRDRWMEDSGGVTDLDRAIDSIREFIMRHESRFRDKTDDQTVVRDLAGYRDSATRRILFTQSGFKEACGAIDPVQVARELRTRGMLFTNDKNKLVSRHHVVGFPERLRLYAVEATIFGTEKC